ncbi:hypothetical protein FN846DRAFT_902251 [Sphaerosporella brunnea]|uniref:Uncharacterized protein n=1 Tax=Sphaerosporella brunnea TaxID=1250544 RepID=A0A5J5FA94_9PEZI|nr:hypothetical protein FN846DRAFT_902251 [Sphaerosporella brunnea]
MFAPLDAHRLHIPAHAILHKSGLQLDPVHGNLDQAVLYAGTPRLGHRSPPKRVDLTGLWQSVQAERQATPAREEHCPPAVPNEEKEVFQSARETLQGEEDNDQDLYSKGATCLLSPRRWMWTGAFRQVLAS